MKPKLLIKSHKRPNTENCLHCERTKIAEEKNVRERKKNKIREENNKTRFDSPTQVQSISSRRFGDIACSDFVFHFLLQCFLSLFLLILFLSLLLPLFLSLNTHRTTRDGGSDPNRTTRLQLRTLSCASVPISFRSHSHRFSSSPFHH